MENFLNDLREYARGNELYSIQLIFNETLTEAFTVAVPVNKGDEKKLKKSKSGKIPKTDVGIYIRCHTDAKFGHSTSVKITIKNDDDKNKRDYTIPVPTKAYSTLRNNAPAIVKLEEFMDAPKVPYKIKQNVRSFIYDNQMAIIAYWYQDTSDSIVSNILERYLIDTMIEGKYKQTTNAKSADELEQDKEMLTNYVRKECQDDAVVLYFGA